MTTVASRGPGGLCRSDRGLLGVHADGRGAADAGAVAFSYAGLFARPAGLSVCALRDRGDRDEPERRLDCGPFRAELDALCRAWVAGYRIACFGAARSWMGRWSICRVCDAGSRRKRRRKRSGQDVVQICGQTTRAGRAYRIVPLGRPADWIEEHGKRVGFFAGRGAACNVWIYGAVLGMAAVLAVILSRSAHLHARRAAKGNKGTKFTEVFSMSPNVNWLSAARVVLFGARDVWFVVGIPIYFYATLSDGTEEGNRTSFFLIGTFMAIWVILYGLVQANAPRILMPNRAPLPS